MPTILAPIQSRLAADPGLGELVQMFVHEIPQRLEALQALHTTADWQGLARAAHQLKGAAGSYGFHELVPYAVRLEAAIGRGGAYRRAAELVEELREACGRLCAS